jgi:ABC-2 type transport system ATP-binding protein
MIDIKKLSKSYASKKVLDNISLYFESGKIYGIVGKNGAGKTTLFNCIAGLRKYKGQITFKEKALKEYIGFLETSPYFLDKITGNEYLQLVTNARNINKSNFDKSNIFELPLNQYAKTYSTGMQKKLAITGMLLQKNKFFILDEPFNGIDIQSNILLTEIILKLKSLGKTILLSSHIFDNLKLICDEIHLLENGKILESVDKNGFDALEEKLKSSIIGDKVENFDL